MSIEAALAENTAALLKVADLLEKSNAGREAAVEAIAGAGATTSTRAPRGRPPGKAADTPPPADPPKTPEAPKVPTETDLREAATTFLTVPDENTKTARKAFVRAILDHVGSDQMVANTEKGKTGVAEDDRAKVIDWMAAFAKGEKVNFSEGKDETVVEEDEDDIG